MGRLVARQLCKSTPSCKLHRLIPSAFLTFFIIRYKRAEALRAGTPRREKALDDSRHAEQARIAGEQTRIAAERAEQARIEAETRAIEQQNENPETWEGRPSGSNGSDVHRPVTTDPFATEAQEKPFFAPPQHSDDLASDSDILELDEPLPDSEASKKTILVIAKTSLLADQRPAAMAIPNRRPGNSAG